MMRTCAKLLVSVLGMGLLCSVLLGADWPGWRGPNRTGVSSEKGLLKEWPKPGPSPVWQSSNAGLGYAGMAIVDGVVYTMGARGKTEYVIALDGKGQEKWATKIGPVFVWPANSYSYGPNGTPTVDGDSIYAVGSQGILVCVSKTGKELWRLDMPKTFAGEVNSVGGGFPKMGWGYSWSPLIDGDLVVITPGGEKGLFAALDKKNKGKLLWRSKEIKEPCTYSSPLVATIGGVKQYIALTQNGLVGVSAKDGELLWQQKRDDPYPDVVCPTPIVSGDLVYASVGFGGGADCVKVVPDGKKFKLEEVFQKKVIGSRQGGVVLLGKYVYGYHEDRNWASQNLAKGDFLPKRPPENRPPMNTGLLAADGRLYAVDERGTVSLLEASPKGIKVISQFALPTQSKQRKPRGGLWTHPSLSDGKLYLRDQELMFCYQVK